MIGEMSYTTSLGYNSTPKKAHICYSGHAHCKEDMHDIICHLAPEESITQTGANDVDDDFHIHH